jgi:hypothetical protein
MRSLRSRPANESVTHKLTTVRRHVVAIEVPSVPAYAEEVFELRFNNTELGTVEVDKANLSHLIRTLIAIRAATSSETDAPISPEATERIG